MKVIFTTKLDPLSSLFMVTILFFWQLVYFLQVIFGQHLILDHAKGDEKTLRKCYLVYRGDCYAQHINGTLYDSKQNLILHNSSPTQFVFSYYTCVFVGLVQLHPVIGGLIHTMEWLIVLNVMKAVIALGTAILKTTNATVATAADSCINQYAQMLSSTPWTTAPVVCWRPFAPASTCTGLLL